jgi:hypothetical protein
MVRDSPGVEIAQMSEVAIKTPAAVRCAHRKKIRSPAVELYRRNQARAANYKTDIFL